MEEQKNEQKVSKEELSMQEIMLKQQALLLQQFEAMTKMQDRAKEKEDEIDLTRLVPGFLRKKSKSENTETNEANTQGGLQFGSVLSQGAGNVLNFTRNITSGAKKGFVSGIKAGFNYFWTKYLESVRKMKVLIAIFGFLGLAYGIYVFMTDDKLYQSSLLIDSGAIDMSFYEALIGKLNYLANTESYDELARKLSITKFQAEQITSLQYNEYEDYQDLTKEETDSTEAEYKTVFFTITAEVKDNAILPTLEDKLFHYMSGNIFASNKKEITKAVLTESVERLQNEINAIDSLKLAVVNRIEKKNDESYFVKESSLGAGGIILSQEDQLEIEPLVPFERSLTLQREQISKKQELMKLDRDFKLIDGFSAINLPVYPRLRHIIFWMVVGLIIGSGLGFLAFMLAPSKKITEQTETSSL